MQPYLEQLQKTHPVNESGSNNTNVHPLVRVEPDVVAARKPNLRNPKCEHERARDVAAEAQRHAAERRERQHYHHHHMYI